MPDTDRPPAAPSKPQSAAPSASPSVWRQVARRAVPLLAAAAIVAWWTIIVSARMRDWGPVKTAIFTIPFLLALVLVGLFYRALGTYERIRRHWVKNNPDDPACKNLLVVYELSRKALYIPTIVVSLAASALMVLKDRWGMLPGLDPKLLGGIWRGVFFLNFLVEEYDIDLRASN
ncbi:MAG: hypothetical protein FJ291_31425 [Planctomycetes bacterium]|nr:hypothetical protein [Planctomycetota bacterium]